MLINKEDKIMPASVNKDLVANYASGLIDFAKQYPLGGDVVYQHLNDITMSDSFHQGMENDGSIDEDYTNELKSRLADALYQSAGGEEHIPPEAFESDEYDVPLNEEGLAYLASISNTHREAMPAGSFVMYVAGQSMGEKSIEESLKEQPMLDESQVVDAVMEIGYKGKDLLLPNNFKQGLQALTEKMAVSQLMMPNSEQNLSGVDSLAATLRTFKQNGRTAIAQGSERMVNDEFKGPMESMSYDVSSEYQIRTPDEKTLLMLSREVSALYNEIDRKVESGDVSGVEDFNKQGYSDRGELFDARADMIDVNRGLIASSVSKINDLNIDLPYKQAVEQRNERTREDKPVYVVSTGAKFEAWPQGKDNLSNIMEGASMEGVYVTTELDVAARISQLSPNLEMNEVKASSEQIGNLYNHVTRESDLSRIGMEVPMMETLEKYGNQGRTPEAMAGLVMKGLSGAGYDLDPSSQVEIERAIINPRIGISGAVGAIQSNEEDIQWRREREEEKANNPPTQEMDKPNFFQSMMNRFK